MRRLAPTLALVMALAQPAAAAGVPPLNLDHLDWLRRDVETPRGQVATWQIYATPERPGDRQGPYRFVGDEDEGVGCVDDVARAAIVYARYHAATGEARAAAQARAAFDFLAYTDRGDGTYANFIWADGSLNLDGPTSKPGLNWWSARALWALAEGARAFRQSDAVYAEALRERAMRTARALEADLARRDGSFKPYGALHAPGWFIDDAPDVTAVALLGLAALHEDRPDARLAHMIRRYGSAIAAWRAQGAHLPSLGPTHWHAYGAHMLHALAAGARVTGSRALLSAAREEADGFTLHVLVAGGPVAGFFPGFARHPQIAYGVEPASLGLLELAAATGEERYARLAALYASWLTGNNEARVPMYDAATGRVWDGIDAKGASADSGAESTIEGLLTLQAFSRRPDLAPYLHARELARHGPRFIEAEGAPGARRVEVPGLVGDAAAELRPGEALTLPLAGLPTGAYRLSPVVLRGRHVPGEAPALEVAMGETTRRLPLAWPPAGAPWPAPEAANWGKVRLTGPASVSIRYTGAQNARLDGVLVEPEVEYRTFAVGDRRVAVALNRGSEPRTLHLAGFSRPLLLPAHGAVTVEEP